MGQPSTSSLAAMGSTCLGPWYGCSVCWCARDKAIIVRRTTRGWRYAGCIGITWSPCGRSCTGWSISTERRGGRTMQGRQASRWGWYLSGAMAVIVGLPVMSWACAICWGGDDALARGMNVSILFLVSMPFLIGGSIAGVLFVAYRRAQGRHW